MKNSPDEEWLSKMMQRLSNYQEEPDDIVWNRIIAASGNQAQPSWVAWADGAGMATAVILLLLALMPVPESYPKTEAGIVTAPDQNALTEDSALTENSAARHHHISAVPSRGTRAMASADTFADAHPGVPFNDNETCQSFEVRVGPDSRRPNIALEKGREKEEMQAADAENNHQTAKKTPIVPRHGKRSIVWYASVSPSIAFQKVNPLHNDGVGIESFGGNPVFSTERFGFAVQSGLQFSVGRRIEMYAGLSIYHQSHTLAYSFISSENVIVERQEALAYSVEPVKHLKHVNYSMLNVGGEVGFMYHLRGERLAHKVGSGISWQHGVKAMSGTDTYNNRQSQYLFYKIFYRNEYALNERTNLFLQPFYRHVIISGETLDEPFTLRPYGAGVSLGVVYRVR